MALILGDRIKETTTVAGTGTATLLGATTGFQSFAAVGNGNTTYYCIADQGGPNWEVGIGTYSSSGTTLARTTVLASSNAGALVVFTTGVKDVFVTYPSEKGVWYDASENVGIGTSSPTQKLQVAGSQLLSSPGNAVYTYFDGTSNSIGRKVTGELAITVAGGYPITFVNSTTEAMRIDSSGNVGIGTSSPGYKLDVTGSSRIANGSTPTAYIQNTNSAGFGLLQFVGDTSQSSYIWQNGSTAAGYGGPNSLNMYVTGAFPITFATNSAERMRIDSSGNVGIGVTDFSSTGANAKFAISLGSINLDDARVLSWGGGSARPYITASKSSAYLAMGVSGTERMRIDSSGNVGIGTSSPTGKLDVAGTIKTLGYTVTTLPTGVVGARAYVTDALTPVFGATVVTGGAVTIPVFYNGTNWIVG